MQVYINMYIEKEKVEWHGEKLHLYIYTYVFVYCNTEKRRDFFYSANDWHGMVDEEQV